MKFVEAKYQTGKLVAVALISVIVTTAFFILPPSDVGRMARVLRTNDGLTALGWVILANLSGFSFFSLFFAIRGLLGLPALSFDGQCIRTYVLPFRRVPISEVESIDVFSEEAKLRMSSGKSLAINVRIVKDHWLFFDHVSLH